jgi:hypothetical protein
MTMTLLIATVRWLLTELAAAGFELGGWNEEVA